MQSGRSLIGLTFEAPPTRKLRPPGCSPGLELMENAKRVEATFLYVAEIAFARCAPVRLNGCDGLSWPEPANRLHARIQPSRAASGTTSMPA